MLYDVSLPRPGRPFSLKRKEQRRAMPAYVFVCACDGEMRGGWREVGVLVSLKSVTHRIGMTSLPKKPGSLLFPSGLLLFRSQTHSLLFSLFFFFFLLDYKSFSVWGDFSIITSRISCSPPLSTESTGRFPFILLYMQTCINTRLLTSAACTDALPDRSEK